MLNQIGFQKRIIQPKGLPNLNKVNLSLLHSPTYGLEILTLWSQIAVHHFRDLNKRRR